MIFKRRKPTCTAGEVDAVLRQWSDETFVRLTFYVALAVAAGIPVIPELAALPHVDWVARMIKAGPHSPETLGEVFRVIDEDPDHPWLVETVAGLRDLALDHLLEVRTKAEVS